MKRLICLLVLPMLVGAGCAVAQPSVYISDQDGFSVTLPASPEIVDRGSKGRTYRAASTDGKTVYLISSAPIPSEVQPLSSDTLLQAYYSNLLDIGIKSFQGRLISSNSAKIDGKPALSFHAEVPVEGSTHQFDGAVVNKGDWTYLVYTTYPEGPASQDAQAFIGSFRFTR